MIYKIIDIEWDTEDNGETLSPKELGLPTEVEVSKEEIVEEFDLDSDADEEEILDFVADYLSDKYGYCLYGFDCESQDLEAKDVSFEEILSNATVRSTDIGVYCSNKEEIELK